MKKSVLTLLMILVIVPAIATEARTGVREDWLAKDFELIADTLGGLERITAKLPITEADLTYLGLPCSADTDLGFGGRRLHHRRPGGYTSMSASILLFESKVALLELKISSSGSWNKVSGRIREAWASNGGPVCQVTENGLVHRIEFPDRLDSLQVAVADALGPQTLVEVPRRYADEYQSLTSPMRSHTIGLFCGVGGSPPAGNEAIALLARKKRWPIIENILRGPNPEGRVYAVLALLCGERHGRKVPPETRATIDTVLALDLPISVCRGCMYDHATAPAIVEEFLDHFESHWYGSPWQKQDTPPFRH